MKLFMSKASCDSSALNSKGMWQSITFTFNITPTVCWIETVTAAFRHLRGCCSILAAVLCLYSPRVFDMNDSQLDSMKGILPVTAGSHSHSRVYHLKAITHLLSHLFFPCHHFVLPCLYSDVFFPPFASFLPTLSPSLMRHYESGEHMFEEHQNFGRREQDATSLLAVAWQVTLLQ